MCVLTYGTFKIILICVCVIEAAASALSVLLLLLLKPMILFMCRCMVIVFHTLYLNFNVWKTITIHLTMKRTIGMSKQHQQQDVAAASIDVIPVSNYNIAFLPSSLPSFWKVCLVGGRLTYYLDCLTTGARPPRRRSVGLPSEPALDNGEQLSSGLSAELAEATREVHRYQADLSEMETEEWGQSYLYHTTIESKSSCHGGRDYTA